MSHDRGHTLEDFGRMAAELIHDLAAEMEVLRARASMVEEKSRIGASTLADAILLREDAERTAQLLSETLGWISGRGRRRPFSPAERLAAVARRSCASAPAIDLQVLLLLPSTVLTPGPGSFFDRIAGNLIRNACRHAHGRVRVSLFPEQRRGARGLVLCVEDDGAGVETPEWERLLEPLVHGPDGGTGLGLGAARWLATELDGSGPELIPAALGGAAFEVWLPMSEGPVFLEGTRPLHGRILIVDDDRAVSSALRRLLSRHGADAVEIDVDDTLLERLLQEPLPDLVLLDRHLSPTVRGEHLWEQMRQRKPEMAERTVLLTGEGAEPDEGSAFPGLPLLSKPLDLGELHRLLRQIRRSSHRPT
jgi:CheY-like chemotaxis protein